jgi:formylglycine-generating enzyme required for sulfatase activity
VKIAKRFAVSKYELTFDQWDTCVQHGSCRDADPTNLWRGDLPVINISWKDAQTYVEWLSYMTGKTYRLLSEAEWEYAARAGTTTPYYWDNNQDLGTVNASGDQCRIPIAKDLANCGECNNGDDNEGTMPVGKFPPNQFGLCDTRGNVWEFTADTAHPNYEDKPELLRMDGSVPWTGTRGRVLRGGSWSSIVSNLTASYRFLIKRDSETYPGVGLRVARELVDAVPTEGKPVSRRGTSGRENTCQIKRVY